MLSVSYALGVFGIIGVSFWATAHGSLSDAFLKTYFATLLKLPKDSTIVFIESTSTLGAMFALEVVSTAIMLAGWFLTTYYGYTSTIINTRVSPNSDPKMNAFGGRRLELLEDD